MDYQTYLRIKRATLLSPSVVVAPPVVSPNTVGKLDMKDRIVRKLFAGSPVLLNGVQVNVNATNCCTG